MKQLKNAFGVDEFGMEMVPNKISNIRISRLFNGENMGCFYCFPHGMETSNNKWTKDLKCWKRYRKTQYYKNKK